MFIFDLTDNFTDNVKTNEFNSEDTNNYIYGGKQHEQPIVTFIDNGQKVIYREEL